MKLLRRILAKLSARRGDVDPAGNVYQLLQEAHAHMQLQEYDKARVLLLQTIGYRDSIRDPTAISYILMALGTTWLLPEKYEDGIAFFSGYINRYPEDSEAYCARAEALWYTGRLQDAIRDYSRALELKPSDISSLSGQGQVLAEVGEHGKAMNDLDLALRAVKTAHVPDSSWTKWYEQIEAFIHNGRGIALAGLGEGGAAFDEFDVSIGLSPKNAWVYHNRAQVYDLAGNREKASADYQNALIQQHPALTPNKRNHAQARLRELQSRS